MITRYNFVIGIDPDLHKSGVAIYDRNLKKIIYCDCLQLWLLFYKLLEIKNHFNDSYLIRLEYPNSTNTWHFAGGKGAALNVGKNQAVAIIIEEFLIDNEILNYELIAPHGYSQIFKDEKTFRQITNWEKRTNNDARSACAMCWNY